jgi:hypothetical protein
MEVSVRSKPQPTHPVFPKSHRELFNTILDEEGSKKNREAYRFDAAAINIRLKTKKENEQPKDEEE